MLFLVSQQMQQSTFGNMKLNVGKQSLKWGDRLIETGAQFGTDRTSTAGIQTGMTRRLLAAKVVRKMVDNVWYNVQRYTGGKQLETQQFKSM